MKKIRKKETGFTLIELLVTIAILSLIIVVVYVFVADVFDISKNNAKFITEKGIREAANIYAYESNPEDWNVVNDYEHDYFCVTIGELVNKGIIKNEKVDKEKYALTTYVAVLRNRNTLTIENEKILDPKLEIDKNDDAFKICTGSIVNEEINFPSLSTGNIYTDEINVKYTDITSTVENQEINITNRECFYGTSSNDFNSNKALKGKINETNKMCEIAELKDSTTYYVRICMDTARGSHACSTDSYTTKKIENPSINIDNNNIKINYKDTNIKGDKYYYFNSTSNSESDIDIYECDNNFNCLNTPTKNIQKDKWYRSSNKDINLKNISETGKVTAITKDKSKNSAESSFEFSVYKSIFLKGNADTINNQANNIELTCITEKDKNCKIKTPTIEKDGYTSKNWNTKEDGTGNSLSVGTEVSISASSTYYPVLVQNPIYVYYHVNGGTITEKTGSYTWTIDSNGIISRNGNKKFFYIESDKDPISDGFVNWNNSNYINITKTGYIAKTKEEWNTKADGTGISFDHNDIYKYEDLMNLGVITREGNNYRLDLYVNWNPKEYTIKYFLGNENGSSQIGTSKCKYKESCTLTKFADFGKTFPRNSYNWLMYGWQIGTTGNLTTELANDNIFTSSSTKRPLTFTYEFANDIELYAVGYRKVYFNSGINPKTYKDGQIKYQYWNPISTDKTDNKYITSIVVPSPYNDEIDDYGWSFIGYSHEVLTNGKTEFTASDTANYKTTGTKVTPAPNDSSRVMGKYQRNIIVKFNSNGGTGNINDIEKTQYYNTGYANVGKVGDIGDNIGSSISVRVIELPSGGFSKEDHVLSKWNDGTKDYSLGTSYNYAPSVTEKNSKEFKAIWIYGDENYTVNHWLQNVDAADTENSTNYELTKENIDTGSGQINSTISPDTKTIPGFISPSKKSITIKADGTSVVDYYYKREKYTVTLTKGTGISSVSGNGTYHYGKLVTLGATVSTGYTWTNWTGTNTNSNINYSFNISGNVSYTANAKINTYTVSYKLNGGINGSYIPTKGMYGSAITISNPTKTVKVIGNANGTGATITGSPTSAVSQTFKGWTSNSDAGLNTSYAKIGTTSSPSTSWTGSATKNTYFKNLRVDTGTVTLTANWTPVAITLPKVTKEGYTCKWNTKSDGSGTSYESQGSYTPSETSEQSITLYARCSAISYNIAFSCNNGTCPSGTTVQYDTSKNISNPTKTVKVIGNINGTNAKITGSPTSAVYQTFKGWTSNSSKGLNTSTAKTGTTSSPSTSWTGSATTNTYFKNLRVDAGTVTLTATWTPVAITLPEVTKTGYTCTWNTKSDGSGTSYESKGSYTPSATSGTSVTLYAQCNPISYNISYSCSGGTCPSNSIVNYDSSTKISNPTKKLTVTGNENGTGATITNSPASKSHTFKGWTSSSSKGLNTSTAKIGTTSTPSTAWDGSLTKYTYFKNLRATSGAVNLTANWSSATVTLPKITKTGYTCTWNTKADGSGTSYSSEGSYTSSSTAVTLYAQCKDSKKPTCSISASISDSKVKLTISGSDNVGLDSSPYSWDDSTYSSTATKTVSPSSETTYTAYVKDSSGNVGSCEGTVSKTTVSKYDKTTKTCKIKYGCRAPLSSAGYCSTGSKCSGNTATSGKCECYTSTQASTYCPSGTYKSSTLGKCYELGSWSSGTYTWVNRQSSKLTQTQCDNLVTNNSCSSTSNTTSCYSSCTVKNTNTDLTEDALEYYCYCLKKTRTVTYSYYSFSCSSGNNLGNGYCYTYHNFSCTGGYRAKSSVDGKYYCFQDERTSCSSPYEINYVDEEASTFTSNTTTGVTSCAVEDSFTCNTKAENGKSYVSKCTPTEYSCSTGEKLNNTYCYEQG